MAKRSDFAQKLLDDLRLRKERLASSQNSNRNNQSIADAYAHTKRNYRGSRDVKTVETGSFRNGHNRSNGGSRSFIGGEATNQIVPFRKGQGSEQMGDLSMAVAFALENGGKLKTDSSVNNSMLGFLQQLGSTSVDYDRMSMRSYADRHHSSTSQFPALSQFHIKEISKGAQRLNQILRACSNGVNFDGYSIEVGKELLKGAMDLQESLKMLVNLQEATDYMTTPKRKTQIRLLDEDEDEDDENTTIKDDQKQLDLPQFSFDKRSRNHRNFQEVTRNDIMMRLAAVAYPSEENFAYEKHSASHKRSASAGKNAKMFSSFSQQKNKSSSSQSKPEKGRIPNVIAKLMGLDELPQKVDSNNSTKKDTGVKKYSEEKFSKSAEDTNTKKVKKRTDDIENLAPQSPRKRAIQPNSSSAVQNIITLQAQRDLESHTRKLDVVVHNRNPSWNNWEGANPITSNEKLSLKVNRKQGEYQDRYREQKGVERSKMKEQVFKEELPRIATEMRTRSETATTFQEKMQHRVGIDQTENVKLLTGTAGQKSPNNHGFQSQKHQAEKVQTDSKHKSPIRKHRGGEQILNTLSKTMQEEINLQRKHSQLNPTAENKKNVIEIADGIQTERSPYIKPTENIIGKRSPTRTSVSKSTNQNASPRDFHEPKLTKATVRTSSVMEKKRVHEPNTSIKVQKREIPPKINEVMIRRGRTKEVKHKSDNVNTLKEVNKVRTSKIKEAEESIIKSNKFVAASFRSQELQKNPLHASTSYSMRQDENQSLKEAETLATVDICEDISTVVSKEHQVQEPFLVKDREEPHIFESSPKTYKANIQIIYPSQVEKYQHQPKSKPLTETENHLKQILIKSQVFINTAEALFKLNIPFDILDAEGPRDCHQDEDSKLVLDCGYEIMKRKGRKQELSVHPFIKVSISAKRPKTLDELIVELNKDFENLKLYGRNGNVDAPIEDYLPRMLESDVYNKDPDLNSMWELNWDEMMFAFIEKDDVVRDVERSVLSGLVDEIALDLLQVRV